MAIMYTLGSALGTTAAYAVEGTRLGTTQLALGARDAYVAKATDLRTKREALTATAPAVAAPQRKIKTATA